MTNINEQIYWVWLSSIRGLGTKAFYQILGKFGDLKTAFENYSDITRLVKISDKAAVVINKTASLSYIDSLLESIRKSGVKILTRINQNYPKNLEEIDNPPPVLYFKGTVPKNTNRYCGIVGSRTPTHMGVKMAREVAESLAYQDVVIISGLARGVDSAAHTGAINANGKTIAVLGCGADIIFPQENFELYNKIAENGAIVSEYLPGTPPRSINFPARNRIISGWSDVLIAGEGGEKSGARITVDFALKFGKSIYTLPFNPNSPVSSLPVMLMQNGANVIKDSLTILDEEGWEVKNQPLKKDEDLIVKGDENVIYKLLLREPMHPDEISAESGIPVKDLNLLLTVMELNGIVKSDTGGIFYIK